MKYNILKSFVLILALTGFAVGQEEKSSSVEPQAPNRQIEIPSSVATSTNSVIVVINSDAINQMLVIDSNGEWVDNARAIRIEGGIGGSGKLVVTCTVYKGVFKPSQLETKTWELKSVVTANQAEFQKIIDGVQKGKFTP